MIRHLSKLLAVVAGLALGVALTYARGAGADYLGARTESLPTLADETHNHEAKAERVTIVDAVGNVSAGPIAAVTAGAAVTCAAASTALIAAGAAGRTVTIYNVGTVDAALGPAAGATTNGARVKAGGDVTLGPLAAAFALDCIRITTDASLTYQVWTP